MEFTQQPINYAVQYAKELLNVYPYQSYFSATTWNAPNSSKYRPISGQTIMIPSLTVSGARAVNRDNITGQFSRNFNNTYEPKVMRMYREWDTIIDPMDIVQTNDVATIANITKTFNETQKIPEMDAYAACSFASFASDFGGVDSTTLTKDNILSSWDSYLVYMVDQRVNRDSVVAYMTPQTYALLKAAAGITRFIEVTSGIRSIDRNFARLDGIDVVEVPSDLMKSLYDFTTGFVADDNASQINLLLVDKNAVIAPIVYDTSMVSTPQAGSKGKYIYYESYYYDVFASNNRLAGFFVNMSAPSLGVVDVTSKAGTQTAGDSIITYSGKMVGNYGIDAYITSGNTSAPSLAYNGTLDTSVTWTKITGQNPITLNAQTAGKYATIALVNKQSGKVVAGGSAIEVVKS